MRKHQCLAVIPLVPALVCSLTVLVCGCKRPGQPADVEVETALLVVAKERCAREGACLHPGKRGRFATPEECVTSFRAESNALNLDACGGIVKVGPLERCLDSIRRVPCDVPQRLDSIERCRAESLCGIDQPGGG